MVFKINNVDFLDYIAFGGLKWTRNDIDSSDTTRMLDGELRRSRVATKIRLDVTCRPLKSTELSTLLSAIMPVFVQVTYTDPQLGTTVTKTMYSNNNPASYCIQHKDGTEWWHEISFPLIEK